MNLTNDTLNYLGGLFDGEGCVASYVVNRKRQRPTYRVTVSINMTTPDVCLYFKNTFGGFFGLAHRDTSRKQAYCWMCSDLMAYKFLIILRPYVKIKTQQFDKAIELHERIQQSHTTFNKGARYGCRVPESEMLIRHQLHNELRQMKRVGEPLGSLTIGANSANCCDANAELNGFQPNPKCVTTIHSARKGRHSLDLQKKLEL